MTKADLIWSRYRQFPYEKRLAHLEVSTLVAQPTHTKRGLRVELNGTDPGVLNRFTYFGEIHVDGGERVVPDQAKVEGTYANGRASAHQPTRYSAHGLHDFRGKFNPQIVRAIGNLLALDEGARVLDPFCGSGTTLLEGAHIGWNVTGFDLNPLAVLISNAKIAAFHASPRSLSRTSQELISRVEKELGRFDFESEWSESECRRLGGASWSQRLGNRPYLDSWFPRPVLVQASFLIRVINDVAPRPLRTIYRMILSDLLRDGSHQEPADLRIRRRVREHVNHNLLAGFVNTVAQRTAAILSVREVIPHRHYRQRAYETDARYARSWPRQAKDTLFDAIITSPPYATALPYVDTQRLSLALLGMLDRDEVTVLERSLTGSRDLAPRHLLAIEKEIDDGPDHRLGREVIGFCKTLREHGQAPENGFRRRNTPALVYAYFRDMLEVFSSALPAVKPGGHFAFVVGPNSTRLGGKRFVVDAPRFLAAIAQRNGWEVQGIEQLDAFPRFDIHSRNSIRTEALVILRRPA